MEGKVIDHFVETWGAMGASWGINRSVARVHGLLLISYRPWTLDEISGRLKISKSNTSTSLKELRAWKVVRKRLVPGDRREFYESEPDAWQMLFSILRERKRRELDPVVVEVAAVLREAKEQPEGIAVDRLRQMTEMLDTFNRIGDRVLSSEARARALISFVEGKM